MTLNDVYILAAYMIGEDPTAADTQDLRVRSAALLSAICLDMKNDDRLYCGGYGRETAPWDGEMLELESEFPLSVRFAPAAAKALAALLVAEENASLSEYFDGCSKHDVEIIKSEIPAKVEKIRAS